MPSTRSHIPLVVGILLMVTLFVLLATLRLNRSPDAGYLESLGVAELQAPMPVSLPPLQDSRGEPFDDARLLGGWNLLFFGFTHCPDVCPATMSLFGRLARNLENDRLGEDTRLILVSVDPERDNAEQLAQYLRDFHPSLLGVRGELRAIRELAANFAVAFNKKPHPTLAYDMAHSANVFFVSPDGHWRAFARPPHTLEKLERGYRVLRKRHKITRNEG